MLLLALAAFSGGIVSGLIGWAESKEAFDPRRMIKTFGASLVAAVGFAVLYPDDGPVPAVVLLSGFLAGAGVDVLSNRGMGWLRKG